MEREAKLKAVHEDCGLCSGSLQPRPDPGKNLTMKEELASKKAKTNQGKETDENKFNRGGLKFHANLFTIPS